MSAELDDADVPAAFPEYEVNPKRLGKGGFKKVYHARDGDHQFVVKILLPPVVENEADDVWEATEVLGARELREMPGLRLIDHPNVARIIDGPHEREIGGALRAWYREEFYPGGDLADRLKAGGGERMSEANAISLTLPLLSAIDALWQQGIVHRDIKPQNIMFDGEGKPVLIDLGIAHFRDLSTLTAADGGSPGTLGFASPEQMLARSTVKFDFRTDLFQVGIVLYLLLTMRLPFSPKDDNYASSLAAGEYPTEPLEEAGVSAGLRSVIAVLLSPEQSGRYRKIEHAVEAMKELVV